jgi:tetratricopeptide (TPR) repeat protein
MVHGDRYAEAETHFRMALQRSPGYAAAHHWYSLCLLGLGRMDESMEAIARARILDPRSPVITTAYARNLYLQRRYAAAEAAYRAALEIDPALVGTRVGLAFVLLQTDSARAAIDALGGAAEIADGASPLLDALTGHLHGRTGAPAAATSRLHALESASREGRFIPPEYLALVHLGMGDHETAIGWLEQAVSAGSGWAMMLRLDPILDPLRGAPRFERLLGHLPGRG